MDLVTISYILKYGFAIILLVEVILIGRALLRVALEKARQATTAAPASQE